MNKVDKQNNYKEKVETIIFNCKPEGDWKVETTPKGIAVSLHAVDYIKSDRVLISWEMLEDIARDGIISLEALLNFWLFDDTPYGKSFYEQYYLDRDKSILRKFLDE